MANTIPEWVKEGAEVVELPPDFEPDGDGFEDVDEMIEHHAEHYAEEEE